MLDSTHLMAYWQGPPLEANLLIALNLLGALLLGMLVGYERAYHGRAAGMRTYAIVCMTSCALTVFAGYSSYWFGGSGSPVAPDPTRVVQGIVSGIGFLCAGAIMRDGLSINGLTTAASLWAASAIGVLIGVGFYGAAVTLAGLMTFSMTIGRLIQDWLPTKESLGLSLTSAPGVALDETLVNLCAGKLGCIAAMDRLSIVKDGERTIWRFSIEAARGGQRISRTQLAQELSAMPGVQSFSIEPTRH